MVEKKQRREVVQTSQLTTQDGSNPTKIYLSLSVSTIFLTKTMITQPLLDSPSESHSTNHPKVEEISLNIPQTSTTHAPESPQNIEEEAKVVVSVSPPKMKKPDWFESSSIIRQSFMLLIIYLSLGVVIYSLNRGNYSGVETHPVVDAIYYCVITLCTIGYGDITPITPLTKVFACVFVLVGFGFIEVLLSGVVNYVLDVQENMILSSIHHEGGFSAKKYIFDAEKGRMRIRMKVGLALGVVILCIGIGIVVMCCVENLSLVDSVYLSIMSVTTVGYGDRAFNTLSGRLFASVWLLFSTLAVARAFLYLAEARIDKRHKRTVKWVLQRDITVEDLVAADVNHNGFISKSDYVIYKLKEMGKISEKDILQICNQFNKLDPGNSGRITLHDILETRR